MKIYTDGSTTSPYVLLQRARERLAEEGFPQKALPAFDTEGGTYNRRGVVLYNGGAPMPCYSDDFLIYALADNPHRQNRKPATQWFPAGSWDFSATFNMWGLLLGAMFDVAAEGGIAVRVGGYDWSGKNAIRKPDGRRFYNSAEVFEYQTMGQFGADQRRARGEEILHCKQHKWGRDASQPDGVSICTKDNCEHTHRFGH